MKIKYFIFTFFINIYMLFVIIDMNDKIASLNRQNLSLLKERDKMIHQDIQMYEKRGEIFRENYLLKYKLEIAESDLENCEKKGKKS